LLESAATHEAAAISTEAHMSRKLLSTCLFAATMMLTTAISSSSTASASNALSTVATFEGRSINLAAGWGPARACLIWRQHGIAECFRTDAQLSARQGQLRNSMATSQGPRCSSPLNLYSGRSYTGSHLVLWDEGYWQELSNYGFNKITVSFLGGACAFHLAQGNYGQGWWYPGYTGAWAACTDMGSWDDTISSAYVD
jgi:hypothetical protein